MLDIGAESVRVSALVDGAVVSEPAEPVVWASPLDTESLGDLRWYLEDYLSAPFAVYGDRGERIAGAVKGYGEALFASVFGSGAGRDVYVDARARGGPGEIVVRSADVGALGLPWELLWDPALATPLALDRIAITRMLPSQVPGRRFPVGGEKLRVLMVIARPDGDRDVAYQMVARRLIPLLDGVQGKVELTVLRPPTLLEFERVITAAADAAAPFHVVHFDGHGAFAPPAGANGAGGGFSPEMYAMNASGKLAFEAPSGGADLVEAERVAQVLSAGHVPLVVLNACQSGQVGAVVEAGVATRLLAGGAASVVAMAYSVYAVAAAEFMAVFYEQLFAGDTVGKAVSAGRRHLNVANRRPSPAGRLELADWMVPVHYARTDLSFPRLKTTEAPSADHTSLTTIMDQVRGSADLSAGETAQDSSHQWAAVDGVFVGRDNLLHDLDTAARLQHVVVLHGSGGTGKTEAAKALGRWWRDTGGVERPEWVVWHSFEPGVSTFGLDGAVTAAGLHLIGAEFAQLDDAERRETLLKVLETYRVLLVWDNFESVYTLPDRTGATAPLDADQRAEMARFLERVRARGKGSILITSRTPEDWLGREVRRIGVGGLNPVEAAEYTDWLLAPYPRAQARRKERAFGQLVEWLDGHPLSMRLTLPQLDRTSPADILAALQGQRPLTHDGQEAGRTASLSASIAYSFTHVSEANRDALTILSLLHGVAGVDVLGALSVIDAESPRFGGIDALGWKAVLDEAAHLGLLTAIGRGMYRIHPALPAHLTVQWRAAHADSAGFEAERDRAAAALLDAYAAFGRWLLQQIQGGEAATAVALIEEHRRTLGAVLGYALDHELWMQAQLIAQPLDIYWEMRGLSTEARGWVDRARNALEASDGTPPDLDTDAGSLWLFLIGSEAARQIEARRFDEAEDTYRRFQEVLGRQQPSPLQQQRLAVAYHQLGVVARMRGDLAAAEEWHHRALTIREPSGDRALASTDYHQLGVIAQVRGDLDAADEWYRRALAITEELGDRPNAADTSHNLGAVAQDRGDLDAAERWYRRALATFQQLGNRPSVADSYHQLGIVAQLRNDFDTAEEWYRRSLTIREQLGDRPSAAGSYHNLGTLAQDRGDADAAEQWYRRALVTFEQLGDGYGTATSYHNLATVAHDRGDLDAAEQLYRRALTMVEQLGDRPGAATSSAQLGMLTLQRGDLNGAEHWYRRALTISESLGDRPAMARSHAQLGLLTRQRGDLAEALQHAVRCVSLFEEIPHEATGTGPGELRELTAQLGIEALKATWLQVTGNSLPDAVRTYATTRGTDDPDGTS